MALEGEACLACRGQAGTQEFRFATGTGRHRIWGTALLTRRSVSVNLHGGESPHVGAIGVGLPRPSRRRPGAWSSTTSILTLPGHREDELVRPLASRLAGQLRRTAVVVAGIHLRGASARDLAALSRNAVRAVELLLKVSAIARRRPGSVRSHRPAG